MGVMSVLRIGVIRLIFLEFGWERIVLGLARRITGGFGLWLCLGGPKRMGAGIIH